MRLETSDMILRIYYYLLYQKEEVTTNNKELSSSTVDPLLNKNDIEVIDNKGYITVTPIPEGIFY